MKRIGQSVGDLIGRARHGLVRVDRRLGGIPSLLKDTFDSYNAHDGTFVSAAIAYYSFFSLFPLVLALIAIGSLFFEAGRAKAAVIDLVSRTVPVFESVIVRNVDLVLAQRGAIGIIATLGFIYSASGLFGALLAVVNRIWRCPAARPSYVQRLLAIGLVLALAAFFFLVAAATTTFQALLGMGGVIGLDAQAVATLYRVVTIASSAVLSAAFFLLLFWKLPATRVCFADAWPAAVAAGLAWEGVRQIYAWYLSRFTNYTLIYGSLAAIIGLLSWLYLTGFIILLGAELSAQIAERRGRGPSVCAVDGRGQQDGQ
jgi:membrane protein